MPGPSFGMPLIRQEWEDVISMGTTLTAVIKMKCLLELYLKIDRCTSLGVVLAEYNSPLFRD